MNNTLLVAVVALVLGGGGGYFAGQNSVDAGATKAETAEMMKMMMDDGARMSEMGKMMVTHGGMMQQWGVKYNDQEMIMRGKDLEQNGHKHESDGMSMMDPNSMMGMSGHGDMHGSMMHDMDHM